MKGLFFNFSFNFFFNYRLKHLFAIKSLWKKEDIEPYVVDFCANLSKVEEFLLKHCKILSKSDGKFFILKQF